MALAEGGWPSISPIAWATERSTVASEGSVRGGKQGVRDGGEKFTVAEFRLADETDAKAVDDDVLKRAVEGDTASFLELGPIWRC